MFKERTEADVLKVVHNTGVLRYVCRTDNVQFYREVFKERTEVDGFYDFEMMSSQVLSPTSTRVIFVQSLYTKIG